MMQNLPKYVLVTPARNEAQFIRLTLESVIGQTVLPLKWVIVSDGSTDGTDDIVARYSAAHPWIELLRVGDRAVRDFAGKVHAFNAGYECVKGLSYEVIGSLDADLSFGKTYFEFLLGKLASDSALGLVGAPFQESASGEMYDYRFVNIEHVSGACQLFRRACFDDIGGYTAVKGGGIDYIAVVNARMKGWKTRTFTEQPALHHRPIGTAQHNTLRSRFKYGIKDYVLGNDPIWELFRAVYQMSKPPAAIGGAAMLAGYCSAAWQRTERPVSPEFVAFVRHEQLRRLAGLLKRQPIAGDSGKTTLAGPIALGSNPTRE